MLLNIVLSVIGFVMLIKCADFFVDGAVSLAKHVKISTAVIGLTIVSFGTSAPELAISFNSHLSGNTDMLFGNVVGSSITNILVILGIAILIKPFKVHSDVVKKEIPILLLMTLGLSALMLDTVFDSAAYSSLSRVDSIILILFFGVFVYYLLTLLAKGKNKNASVETVNEQIEASDEKAITEPPKYKLPIAIAAILVGLGGIVIGSNLVVDNVASFAETIGISQKIISVTIISIGTSLPELVTTITAAKKGENAIAIGNIVGSNIFNICIVLGLPVLILGEAVTTAFGLADVIFMLIAVILLWIFSATNREIRRYEGMILIAVYCFYGVYIFVQ